MRLTSRRKFLFDSPALAALGFMSGFMSGCTKPRGLKIDADKWAKGFTLLRDKGMNLRFYLVNLQIHDRHLVPKANEKEFYIIVQIPAQSLHEKYYLPANADMVPQKQQQSKLSGCSFLVFRLWKEFSGVATKKSLMRMPFSAKSLLNWTDTDTWHLQTTIDPPAGKFKSFGNKTDTKTSLLSETNSLTVEKRVGIEKYKELLGKFLDHNKPGDPSDDTCFLTLFELPTDLFLVPHIKPVDHIEAVVVQNNVAFPIK